MQFNVHGRREIAAGEERSLPACLKRTKLSEVAALTHRLGISVRKTVTRCHDVASIPVIRSPRKVAGPTRITLSLTAPSCLCGPVAKLLTLLTFAAS